MILKPFSLVLVLAVLAASPAKARLICNGAEVDGWHFYCDPDPLPNSDQPQLPETKPVAIPEEELPPAKIPTATEEIATFRAYADELKHRAILDPTPQNVRAYMEVNTQMARQAARFAAVWQRVLFNAPHLDANVARPLTQMGTNIYQDQRNAAEQAAIRRVASEAGLIFVYDDPVVCRLCLAQAQILDTIRTAYGIDILAVATDASPIAYFPDAVPNDGQLEALNLSEVPRPFIAIVDTSIGETQLIGGGLLTEDQILERIYIVREIPVGARFE